LRPSPEFVAAISQSITAQRDAKWTAVLKELAERRESGAPLDQPTAAEWAAERDPDAQWPGPSLEWV